MISSPSPAKSNKLDAIPTIEEDTHKLTKDQKVHISNPYVKPSEMNHNSIVKTPDTMKDAHSSLPISSPRFPPFSPPYSDMKPTTYSPQSPQMHVNPPPPTCKPSN